MSMTLKTDECLWSVTLEIIPGAKSTTPHGSFNVHCFAATPQQAERIAMGDDECPRLEEGDTLRVCRVSALPNLL